MVVVNCDDCTTGRCRHRVCCKYKCTTCKEHGKWKKEDEEKKDPEKK